LHTQSTEKCFIDAKQHVAFIKITLETHLFMSTIFSVICYPSGLTIPPDLLCYRSFEVY